MPSKPSKGGSPSKDGEEAEVVRHTRGDLLHVREKVGKCRSFLNALERIRQEEIVSAAHLQREADNASQQAKDLHAALRQLNDRTRVLLAELEKAHKEGRGLDDFIQEGSSQWNNGSGGSGSGSGGTPYAHPSDTPSSSASMRVSLPHNNIESMMGGLGSPRMIGATPGDEYISTPHFFAASPRFNSVNSFLQPSPLYHTQTNTSYLQQPSSTPILSSTSNAALQGPSLQSLQ